MGKMYNVNRNTRGKAKNRKIYVGTITKEDSLSMLLKSRGYQAPITGCGAHKSKKDYDRRKAKLQTKKALKEYL